VHGLLILPPRNVLKMGVRCRILHFGDNVDSILLRTFRMQACPVSISTFRSSVSMKSRDQELKHCDATSDIWDITAPGRQCLDKTNEAPMMWAHGAINVAIDVSLVILPIWVIYSRMKFSMKTVQVILVFCVGIIGVILGIIRLVFIVSTDFTIDTYVSHRCIVLGTVAKTRMRSYGTNTFISYSTFKMARLGSLSDLAGHVGFWTCCFPALQPLIHLVGYKLGLRSTLASIHQKPRKSGFSGRTVKKQGEWTRRHGMRSQGYSNLSDDREYLNNASGHGVEITAGGRSRSGSTNVEFHDLEKGGKETAVGKGIYKKTDVKVHVGGGKEQDMADQPRKWDAL
jgi:hypothetical protein